MFWFAEIFVLTTQNYLRFARVWQHETLVGSQAKIYCISEKILLVLNVIFFTCSFSGINQLGLKRNLWCFLPSSNKSICKLSRLHHCLKDQFHKKLHHRVSIHIQIWPKIFLSTLFCSISRRVVQINYNSDFVKEKRKIDFTFIIKKS